MSLCEVTGGNSGDNINFGDIYYGGKKCIFGSSDLTRVTGLQDVSSGVIDTKIDGSIFMYLYRNGSGNPTNTGLSAIQVMQASGLTYTWDTYKEMSRCAFAIVQLNYNANAGVTSLQQTQFQVINERNSAGDCFFDYLTNTVYGAAIPSSQIDMDSIAALNTYCNQTITYTPYSGGTSTPVSYTHLTLPTNREV